MQTHGTLEIPEDVAFERRAWRVQRVGWGLMVLLILAAVAGLLGGGPLARAEASAAGLAVEYERFCRNGGDCVLELRVDATGEGAARVWFARDYLARFELLDVVPAPERVESNARVVRMTFDALEAGDPVHVRIRARPRALGRVEGAIGVDGGGQVRFTHLSYP